MKQAPKLSTPRPNIAALSVMLRQYVPDAASEIDPKGPDDMMPLSDRMTFSLVNEIATIGSDPANRQKHAHTVDQLIAMIAMAWPEIESMARETVAAIHQKEAASKTVDEIFYRVMGRHIEDGDEVLSVIGNRTSFRSKCEDVLRKIANDTPADKAKDVATRFLKEFDTKEPVIALVNENVSKN